MAGNEEAGTTFTEKGINETEVETTRYCERLARLEGYARKQLSDDIATRARYDSQGFHEAEYRHWRHTQDFDYRVNRDRYQLAQDVGGWFAYIEGSAPWRSEFVPMDEWLARYAEWEARQ
jgi:hypothetical protein